MPHAHVSSLQVRLTVAGQLIGPNAPDGALRPPLISLPAGGAFGEDDSVLVDYVGIRAFGRHHLFLRGALTYRH